jgi:putative Mn2+ efflux pump MntP
MNFPEVLAIAIGLGADAMSVCVGIGVKWHGPGQRFRLAWHMGMFQFLMPLLGWTLGRQLAGTLAGVGGYIAAGLVFAIGAKMVIEVLKSHPGAAAEQAEHAAERAMHVVGKDPTRGLSLLILSVATSIDALVVGFSLALRGQHDIWWVSLVIGLVAAAMALTGVMIGRRLGEALGRWAELAGAVILMSLGVCFLWL